MYAVPLPASIHYGWNTGPDKPIVTIGLSVRAIVGRRKKTLINKVSTIFLILSPKSNADKPRGVERFEQRTPGALASDGPIALFCSTSNPCLGQLFRQLLEIGLNPQRLQRNSEEFGGCGSKIHSVTIPELRCRVARN